MNVKLTLDLSRKIEERSENEKPPAGMTPQDYILKIVYEELLAILGKSSNLKIQPQTIMLVGLYGQGKTTTAGKLARFFIKKGLSTGFVACDVHRPAAFEQLRTLSEQTGAKFFGIKGEKNPVKIFNQSIFLLPFSSCPQTGHIFLSLPGSISDPHFEQNIITYILS